MIRDEWISALQKNCQATFGITPALSEVMCDQLWAHKELLQEWNQKMNLTSVDTDEGILYRHVLDSLSAITCADFNAARSLADVGTGAGFPGIPLKIIFPHLRLTLIEATRKKTVFLEEVVKKLGLTDVSVVWNRSENIRNNDKYDIITARAVAKLPELIKNTSVLLKIGGKFIVFKQENIEEELISSESVLKTCRISLESRKIIEIFDGTAMVRRVLLVYKKYQKT